MEELSVTPWLVQWGVLRVLKRSITKAVWQKKWYLAKLTVIKNRFIPPLPCSQLSPSFSRFYSMLIDMSTARLINGEGFGLGQRSGVTLTVLGCGMKPLPVDRFGFTSGLTCDRHSRYC